MILTDERQSHFARILVDKIWNEDLVDYTDEDLAIKLAKKGIAKFVKEFEDIDAATRKTITNLKRNVMEGTPEWDVLYGKYFEAELQKRNVL